MSNGLKLYILFEVIFLHFCYFIAVCGTASFHDKLSFLLVSLAKIGFLKEIQSVSLFSGLKLMRKHQQWFLCWSCLFTSNWFVLPFSWSRWNVSSLLCLNFYQFFFKIVDFSFNFNKFGVCISESREQVDNQLVHSSFQNERL